MFLKILLLTAFLCCAVFLIVLFLPVAAYVEWKTDENTREGNVKLLWGFPFLLSVSYDLHAGEINVKAFGRLFFRRKKEKPPEDGEEDMFRQKKTDIGETGSGTEDLDNDKAEENPESKNDFKAVYRSYDESDSIKAERRSDFGPEDYKKRDEDTDDETGRLSMEDNSGSERSEGPEQGFIQKLKMSFPYWVFKQNRYLKKYLIWVFKIIKRLLNLISFDCLTIRVKLSTGEPAVNGVLAGLSSAVNNALELEEGRGIFLDLQPDFRHEEYFASEGCFRIKSSLSRFVYYFMISLITFPFFSSLIIFLNYRKYKKEKKISSPQTQA